MSLPVGTGKTGPVLPCFDLRMQPELRNPKIRSEGNLLVFRKRKEVLSLRHMAGDLLNDTQTGDNPLHACIIPTRSTREGLVLNGHSGRICEHLLFVINQFGHLESRALRPCTVRNFDGWGAVLKLVIARYADDHLMRFIWADVGDKI